MPVTVAITTSIYGVGNTNQRLCFYAKGRHWLFYYDGVDIYYITSVDGIVWGDAVFVKHGISGDNFSITLDGDYVHYAYAQGSYPFYRRGLLGADGSITWGTEQNTGEKGGNYSSILIDADGYPWIAWRATVNSDYFPYIMKSSKKDGTWATDTGFPYALSNTSNEHWRIIIVKLSTGELYVVYGGHEITIKGILYDGAWGSEETVSSSKQYNIFLAALVDSEDNVHVVFEKYGRGKVIYVKRTYGVGWGSEEVIVEPGTAIIPHISFEPTEEIIYVTCGNDRRVKLIRNVKGSWELPQTWVVETGLPRAGGVATVVTPFIEKQNSHIGAAWVRNESSPYDIQYGVLVFIPTVYKRNSRML